MDHGIANSVLYSSGRVQILDSSLDGGTEHVTKWHYTWSPVFLLAFCLIFEPDPSGEVLVPSLAGKGPKPTKTLIYILVSD